MPIRKIHAGQVYLGKEILKSLGIEDGDEVEVEVKGNVILIKPIKTMDKDTLELLKLLREVKGKGGREDYFEEYDCDNLGG